MRIITRKIMPLMLALTIAFGQFVSVPLPASAAGEVCQIGATPYATLDLALAAVPAGGPSTTTIRLLDNITYTAACVIDNKKINFDLNGKNLIFNNPSGTALEVKGASAIDYTGTGSFKAIGTGSNSYGLYVNNNSSCKLTYAEINNTGNLFASAVYCANNSIATVEGDVKASGTGYPTGVSANRSKITVNGNIVSDYTSVSCGYGSDIIVNGNVTSARNFALTVYCGGTVTIEGTVTAINFLEFSSPEFERPLDLDDCDSVSGDYLVYTMTDEESANYIVRVKKPSGWVEPFICQIGSDAYYKSLDAAVNAVPANTPTVIKLLKNITYTSQLEIINKKITFDLNGFNLIFRSNQTCALSLETSTIDYMGSGSFQVIQTNSTSSSGFYGLYASDSTCKLTYAEVDVGTAIFCGYSSTVTVNGNVEAKGNWSNGVITDYRGTITVNGNIKASGENSFSINVYGGSTATVNGNVTSEKNIAVYCVSDVEYWGKRSTVTITGNVTSNQFIGVRVSEGGTVTVDGNVEAVEAGVKATNGGIAIVNGSMTVDYYPVIIEDNESPEPLTPTTKPGYFTYTDGKSTVWVKMPEICQIGSINYTSLDDALDTVSTGNQTAVTVKILSDITHTTTFTIDNKKITFDLNGKWLTFNNSSGTALVVKGGAVVDYTGSGNFRAISSGSGSYCYGLNVLDNSSCKLTYAETRSNGSSAVRVNGATSATKASAIVNGDVKASGSLSSGVNTYYGSAIINGNIHVTGTSYVAVYTGIDSTITVNGNITANNIGVFAPAGTVTVNGTITASVYIRLTSGNKTAADFTNPTSNPGYLTYTDGESTVWVKEQVAPNISGPESMSLTTGYTATSTDIYTVTGFPVPTVTKMSGDSKITWNSTSKKLNIGVGLPAGTYPVTLKAANGILPDATLTFTLTVTAGDSTVTNVAVSPSSVSIQKGGTQQFNATVEGTNHPSQLVTWKVSGKNSAGTNISDSGLLTIGADETAAALTVTATSAADTGKSGTASVIVTDSPVAAGITGPTNMVLRPGYAATSTGVFVITGTSPVTVTVNNDHGGKIIWNNITNKLDIAVGLPVGIYEVILSASNNIGIPATLLFKLTVEPIHSSSFALAVINGTGSGDYAAGMQVFIMAGSPPSGKVFDKWISADGGTFADITSPNTIFTMPANAVTVTAMYKNIPSVPTAKTPTADKAGKTYTGSIKVKLTSVTPGAKIHYTLDGKVPTVQSKFIKSGQTVTIDKTTTLKFMAAASGYKNSPIGSVKYTIKTTKPNVKAVPKSKKIKKGSKIKLTAPKGIVLYYTVNGKNPTEKSKTKVKSGKSVKIKITKTTTLKVISKKSGCLASAIVKRKYSVK